MVRNKIQFHPDEIKTKKNSQHLRGRPAGLAHTPPGAWRTHHNSLATLQDVFLINQNGAGRGGGAEFVVKYLRKNQTYFSGSVASAHL